MFKQGQFYPPMQDYKDGGNSGIGYHNTVAASRLAGLVIFLTRVEEYLFL
jgi:hypothetical protein